MLLEVVLALVNGNDTGKEDLLVGATSARRALRRHFSWIASAELRLYRPATVT